MRIFFTKNRPFEARFTQQRMKSFLETDGGILSMQTTPITTLGYRDTRSITLQTTSSKFGCPEGTLLRDLGDSSYRKAQTNWRSKVSNVTEHHHSAPRVNHKITTVSAQ